MLFLALKNKLNFSDLRVYSSEDFHLGKTKSGEVDFVVQKNNAIKYIQVCLYLSSENTIEREFGAYKGIMDNYEKYVISLDENDLSRNGIKHINAFDFFMNDNF